MCKAPLLASAREVGEELRMEVVGFDVHLPGVDANDGSILLVEVDDLQGVLAPENHIIVELIELGQSRQLGSRDVGDGTEPQPLDGEGDEGDKQCTQDQVHCLLPRHGAHEVEEGHLVVQRTNDQAGCIIISWVRSLSGRAEAEAISCKEKTQTKKHQGQPANL